MKIGGRAYSNGVRLFGDNYSVKVYYNRDNKLRCSVSKNKFNKNKFFLRVKKIPVLRGILSIIFAFIMLFKEVKRNPKRFWPLILIVVLDLAIESYFFFFASSNNGLTFLNSTEFYYSVIIILIITLVIFRFTILQDIFKFHGAEHKAVNYYQQEDSKVIDSVEALADKSRLARRCGTNLLVITSILLFIISYFSISINFYLATFLTIGLAYEILLLLPNQLLKLPFLLQRFTTIEPNQHHLKAAATALNILLRKEENYKNKAEFVDKGVVE